MSNTKSTKQSAAIELFDLDMPKRRSPTATSGARRIDLGPELSAPIRSAAVMTPAPAPAAPSKKAAPAARPAARPPAPRGSALRRHLSFALDRAMLITSAVLLVSSVSTVIVQRETGLGHEPTMRQLTRQEAPALSSLLVLGDLRIAGDDQRLHGWISGTRWRALAPEARRSAAEDLARSLSKAGIATADLYDHDKLVLVIRDGALRSAVGAELR